ncbi:MAG: hypothetical protein WCK49_08595, partial [Myxococcaceae bacterium]
MNGFARLIEKYSEAHHRELTRKCSPILEKLGISHFNYETISNTGHLNSLTTRPDWMLYFGENLLRQYSPLHVHPENLSPGFYWSKLMSSDFNSKIIKYASNFGIAQMFFLVERDTVGCSKYTFGFHSQRIELGFLVQSEIDILRKFTIFFNYFLR